MAVAVAAQPAAKESNDLAKLESSGPLARLPSPPGPHIAKIQALRDNEWINIGPAAPDPKWGPGTMRIVVTTHNLNCYAAIVHRPKGERLTEFEARTIWKNERGLFRLLEEVK